MRKQLFFSLVALATIPAIAQNKKPATKTAAATSQVNPLKNANDSLSYAFGVSIGGYLASQGVTKVNYALLNKAVEQSLKKEKTYCDANEANQIIGKLAQAQMSKSSGPEKAKGEKFLAENKKKAGVKVTASGLQYEILQEGNGPKPTATDNVKAHYKGTLIDGKEFDNSYTRGEPLQIGVSSVIKGWTEALQMMPVGSKWRLYIPSSLGYGDSGAGSGIPGGATLIFDVELLEIVK